jgi:histone H1/5
MQRIVLAWAALALGLSGSPVAAQQAHGGPTSDISTRYLQSVPPAPPPPRKVVSKPRPTKAATHSTRTSPKAKTAHKAASKRQTASAKRHQAASKHKPASSKRQAVKSKRKQASKSTASARPAKLNLSARTIRQCHGMSYSQIMGHRNCRALMKQELAAADAKHSAAKKKTIAKKKAPAKKTTAKRAKAKRSKRR